MASRPGKFETISRQIYVALQPLHDYPAWGHGIQRTEDRD